jgi:hypothetical protein
MPQLNSCNWGQPGAAAKLDALLISNDIFIFLKILML